ncbi:hypothetical protein [Scytonema sp. PRP1]|uniref:hypothetical protein n=1 Tax=Scytonema sp. PRP1 TaxID=3120513 RepID=UPI002FD0F526
MVNSKEHDSSAVEKAILESFNRQSLLSNDDLGWSGIRFQFIDRRSASALPHEIIFPENAIHIAVLSSLQYSRNPTPNP